MAQLSERVVLAFEEDEAHVSLGVVIVDSKPLQSAAMARAVVASEPNLTHAAATELVFEHVSGDSHGRRWPHWITNSRVFGTGAPRRQCGRERCRLTNVNQLRCCAERLRI